MPKAIHLLVNDLLPEDLRSNDRKYTKKEVNELIRDVSARNPQAYGEFVDKLKEISRRNVYLQGSTLRLSDFKPAFDKPALLAQMDQELDQIKDIKNQKEQKTLRLGIYAKYAQQLTDEAMRTGRDKGSKLAGIIASGARGNPSQYRAMIATPALYMDYNDDPIDMFVRRSFAEGVRPIDFLASTFGTRKSVIATKKCLREGTLVRMADGTVQAIETLKPGDMVMGADLEGNTAPVRVVRVYEQGLQDVRRYTFATGLHDQLEVQCTADHKFLSLQDSKLQVSRIHSLRLSGKLVTLFNSVILFADTPLGQHPCWDIEVDNEHHLFVLANGMICSNSTADAGDLGKLFVQNSLSEVVTHKKSLSPSGILLDPKEDQIRGRVLARDTAGYPAGTLIDRKVESGIRAGHKGRVMVHSPLSEISEDGISAEAFGRTYDNVLPFVGFHAGATAGNALSEPLAQGSLNTKHGGGAFQGGKKVFSGFDYVSQFVQVPESFKDRAAVSELQGKVTRIEPAPHGGTFIYVNDERHYVLPNLDVLVKEGQEVEPGEILSDGLANPRDIIRLRGLGEGRRYYARRLKQLLDDSGQAANLRNTEVIARGALDAVEVGEGLEGHLPDSIISYNKLAATWVPRDGYKRTNTKESAGKYLERPILHYTIGTKLTPRMLDEIKEAGFDEVDTHDQPPPFEPVQVRLRTSAYETSDDWLARTGSSYLQKNIAESAQRGYDTNILENSHPLPRLAYGAGFGDQVQQTGKF